MIKVEKEYNRDYGHISENQLERILSINPNKKLHNVGTFDLIKRICDIPWANYDCVIWLLPKGSNRPRRRKDRETFYVQGASDNLKIFRKFILSNPHEMICNPVIFNCDLYLPIPRSMHPTEQLAAEMGYIRPISKPDFDNLAKTYSDMLSGSLIYDDDQIIESTIRKYYSFKPRIELHMKYMTEPDSCFNKKKITKRFEKANRKDE